MLKTVLRRARILGLSVALAVVPALDAQQSAKPLTNTDIIKMTKSGLAESTILAVIKAGKSNFDVSPDSLIAMKTAGVSQNVISAVVTAASSNNASSPATPQPDAGAKSPVVSPTPASTTAQPPSDTHGQTTQSKEPSVILVPVGARAGSNAPPAGVGLPLEKTQLAQTKSKSSSLGGFANDSAATQALQSGVNTAAWEGAVRTGSMGGEIAASQAGGIFGTVMSRRKSAVTYLWAVTGPTSAIHVPSNQPSFLVNFSGWMYVSLDDFEPVIVKLTPTTPPAAFRLVGASQGKENAFSNSAVDWQVFSNFVQDQAPTQVKKVSSGVFEVSPQSPLEAGEYGIVLRPISKAMKFSGADVARNQGNGKVFNSVWTFAVK